MSLSILFVVVLLAAASIAEAQQPGNAFVTLLLLTALTDFYLIGPMKLRDSSPHELSWCTELASGVDVRKERHR